MTSPSIGLDGAVASLGSSVPLRPEGPVLNSHVREGVEKNTSISLEARRADTYCVLPCSAPSALSGSLESLIHALTDVAI